MRRVNPVSAPSPDEAMMKTAYLLMTLLFLGCDRHKPEDASVSGQEPVTEVVSPRMSVVESGAGAASPPMAGPIPGSEQVVRPMPGPVPGSKPVVRPMAGPIPNAEAVARPVAGVKPDSETETPPN